MLGTVAPAMLKFGRLPADSSCMRIAGFPRVTFDDVVRRAVFALLLVLPTAVSVAPVNAANAAPPRALSLLINPRTSGSTPTYQDYVDAAMKLQQLDAAIKPGATGLFQGASWADLEPSQGRYTLDSLTSIIDTTPQQHILVNIGVIDTTNKTTPAFLQGTSFDSPVVRADFRGLIDQLKPHLTSKVKYVALGNEVDVYLSQHPDQWSAYATFFEDAAAYIHTVAPNVLVGVTATYDGLIGPNASLMATLNAASDVWIATYYPIDGYFVPRGPGAALTELPRLANLTGGKPLVIQEVGYPSASALGSSEQDQAQFIANVFQVWRTLGGNQVPFVNFVSLHDTTPSVCAQYALYYGVGPLGGDVNNFKAYFCSLGIRRSDGTPKPAWNTFLRQAAAFASAANPL
jgi:hypothetical protein